MAKCMKEVYNVHHFHTDVGHTDLQEQIIYNQVNNTRTVIADIQNGYSGAVFEDSNGTGKIGFL